MFFIGECDYMKINVEDPSRSWYHWLIIASCCCLTCASIGLISNCCGLFYIPVANEFGIGRGSVAVYTTIFNLVGGFSGPLIAKLMYKMNFNGMLVISGIMLSLSIFLLSFAGNIIVFYALAPVIGIGYYALGSLTVTVLINHWFNKKNGLATGIALCASGIGGAIFNPILSSVISNMGWRTAYRVEAIAVAVLVLPVSIFIIRFRPDSLGLKPYGGDIRIDESIKEEHKVSAKATALLSIPFILICIVSMLTSGVCGIGQHFPGYASELGAASEFGALMVSASMIGNISSKLVIGVLSDKIGSVKSCIVMYSFSAAALLFLFFINTSSSVALIIPAFMYGFIYSVGSVGMPLVIKNMYGREKFANAFAYAAMFGTLGYSLILSGIGYVYDITGTYRGAMLGAAVMIIVSSVILILINRKKKA
jgi:MFS family permease